MLKIIRLNSIDSTNNYLKRNHRQLDHLTVVVSEVQTVGKGRMGREWKSQKGNLFFSMLLKLSKNTEGISLIPLYSALAVYDVLESIGIKPEIKWPNDVLVGKKKICGILVENIIEEDNVVIVGIGINANNSRFDEELKAKATSIIEITGKETDVFALAADLAAALEKRFNSPLEEYTSKCVTLGSRICAQFGSEKIWGRAVGINADGSLLMENDKNELMKIYAGEVSIRSERGYI